MGEFLAMMSMFGQLRAVSLLLAVGVGLSGCSSENVPGSMAEYLGKQVGGGGAEPAAAGQPKGLSQLSRAAIANVNAPFALVLLPEIETASTVAVAAVKGDAVTWVGVDGSTLTFIGPVLFSTRGIGPDLLTAEAAPLAAMLRANRSGQITRNLRHLDTLGQIVILPLDCTVDALGPATIEILERQHQTRQFRETCAGPDGLSVENLYWLGADGTQWQSRQWVSKAAGYLVYQRLVK
ncbi:YjbF family lipoprotein [Pseudoruegeria sp. SK021]|uniref:YjbF family lipoprotein n=1 Tax=Pseudoruegeria sp. SK021 TaxID=1933035 RepID=UPI000A22D73A|nr:YjbF family lipoprotein [Pseudoruegeria sp. SK021]OSP56812.1 hypothetical protein BV911_02400 [Pseudoruegeria sp. SK021]